MALAGTVASTAIQAAALPPSQPRPNASFSALEAPPPLPSQGPTGSEMHFHSSNLVMTREALRKMGFSKHRPPTGLSRFKATETSFLFKATWKSQKVVVKQLHPGVLVLEDEIAEMQKKRYWQEFEFTKNLRHPAYGVASSMMYGFSALSILSEQAPVHCGAVGQLLVRRRKSA